MGGGEYESDYDFPDVCGRACRNVRFGCCACTYGISARPGSPGGERFVRFVLSPEGKKILEKNGFN